MIATAKQEGDPISIEILERGASSFVKSLRIAIDRALIDPIRFPDDNYKLVCVGSIFEEYNIYIKKCREVIANYPNWSIITSEFEGIVGALVLSCGGQPFINAQASEYYMTLQRSLSDKAPELEKRHGGK